MTIFSSIRLSPSLRSLLVLLLLGYSSISLAKSTGVDEDTKLQSGPCYQALVDRNIAQPTTAPNRELAAACQIENGDVEKAWARAVRLWGASGTDLPDYDSYRHADYNASASISSKALAFVGMLLAYAVCGTPVRSVARLLSGSGDKLLTPLGAAASLVGRALIGLLFLALFAIPYAPLIASLAFTAIVALKLRRAAPLPRDGYVQQATGFIAVVTETFNDAIGAAPALVGLSLLAQHDPRLLLAAVGFAIVASIPKAILARRQLLSKPLALGIAGALLAAIVGALAVLEPSIAALIGSGPVSLLAGSLAPALTIIAWVWTNSHTTLP